MPRQRANRPRSAGKYPTGAVPLMAFIKEIWILLYGGVVCESKEVAEMSR